MQVIHLKDEHLIAKGGHRSCYRNPDDHSKCIKVMHENWQDIGRRINDPLKHFRTKTHFHENLGELKELKIIERKIGQAMQHHFPMAYGFIETNLGQGLVTDFIRDCDGRPAHTLKSYLWEFGYDEQAQTAVEAFWGFLFENAIIIRDPDPHNICLAKQEDQSLRAYLIDGFGRSDFLPFVKWFPSRARRKLAKRKARQENTIKKNLAAIEQGVALSGKGVVKR